MSKNTDFGSHMSVKRQFHTLYILPLFLAIPVGLLAQASALTQNKSPFGHWQNIQESQADFVNGYNSSKITVKCDKPAQRLVLGFSGYSEPQIKIATHHSAQDYTLLPDEKGQPILVFKRHDSLMKTLASETTQVTFEGHHSNKWMMQNNHQLARIIQYCWH
ncbi:MAG: hypothetical protein ABF461_07585 [Zymomonas mobilis subsp. pomaceae]|uniref:Uncharacterized protein n=1 Tax=Zymomonas mobilis subsp. pomaceae (strain ATCC 29192 / DSM 22645 / JCM 10191 / CCUG 17912 / NBRC 13757 / NCIMB 11200 / NRRL B-4491 / Barker I) TaxID=579138 RepID=F8EV61_ZYMMT|nr:hypothetical protein [Zymomonas mobilis]AEI38279.1 hypothetical protein Zymop_1389 [Zymomonas mobilis subsp. pomaceae ATCC 29192]MDX5947968.1 hypothetical protein [Zymomonas mobilis subsp. pomaceae]GEB89297.1 hypothetical protein ZMO02_09340 [Zymomonas mobilis subsp. pomaceae]